MPDNQRYIAMLEELHWQVRAFFRYDGIDTGRAVRAKEMMRDIMDEVTHMQQYGDDEE